jgi:hypothetical protein
VARLSSHGLGWDRAKQFAPYRLYQMPTPFSANISYRTAKISNCGALGTLIDLRTIVATRLTPTAGLASATGQKATTRGVG